MNVDAKTQRVINALQDCCSVMDRDLNGLILIQPELAQAKQALEDFYLVDADFEEWNGEGLPPVGTFCTCGLLGRLEPAPLSQWREGDTIQCVAHVNLPNQEAFPLFWNARTYNASTLASNCYSPIRTPEQIAAAERQKSIESLAGTLLERTQCPSPYVWELAQKAYDAGYRKEVKP